jgi:glycosyltransferase involved in cell wall biosynthesis
MIAPAGRRGAGRHQRRSRVAQVGPDPEGRGGMAAVMRQLSLLPVARRYPMDTIVTYRGPRPVGRALTFAIALARLFVWCAAPGPRVVHVHATVRGSLLRKSLCVLLAGAFRRPVLLHLHAGAGDIEAFAHQGGRLRRRLVRMAFQRADAVLAVSEASAARLRPRFGRDDVIVVHNPAPESAVSEECRGAKPEGQVDVLYLGGFEKPVKGGDVLVAALPEIASACPDLAITLAGPGEAVEPPAVGERVRWAGWLEPEAKRRALACADVFVLPSRSEGLPVAVLEAMANGLAIVASRVGGIPEILVDGRDAVLVDAEDPAALADAVIVLARDPRRREALGEAARRRAAALNRDDVSDRLAELYECLLDAGRS